MASKTLIISKSRLLGEQIGQECTRNGSAGWEVIMDLAAALDTAERLQPSCIVLDANLPGRQLPKYCALLADVTPSPIVLTYSPEGPVRGFVEEARKLCSQITEAFEAPFDAADIIKAASGQMPQRPAPFTMKNELTHQWLKTHPEVLGYALISPEGYLVESTGKATADHCGVINYLLEMGRALGSEMGLENLSEMQIYSKDSRILNTAIFEGSVSVITTPKVDLKAVAAKLQEGLS